MKLNNQPSFVRVGDLDITGDKITVEAIFNRTTQWIGSDLYQGDLVSKHQGPQDCNYLLRPGSAEITTTTGYYKTPAICNIELNKTYHAAMVYDGSTLKFYRNGFLMSQIAASGNLIQNNWQTQIGLFFSQVEQENFIGYINEVRIWNIVRTQSEIQTYMKQSISSPQTTSGLLAYYTFDNLLNKQGNPTWNGILSGNASINATNPNCNLIVDSCNLFPPQIINVIPDFTIPDTVCVNTPINIINTSKGASSYYWNFCVANINNAPVGTNLGNPGGLLKNPVYIDYVSVDGNYYGFLTNNVPGKLLRLNFGNSLLNSPVITDLGNVGGVIPNNTEGLQIIFNEGKWYVIVVGGAPAGGTPSVIVKIELGVDIENNSPTGTNWGNIGNLAYPHDLYVFQDNNRWYGLTVNTNNNTITRFDFTTSFSNTPTGVNLGNIGNLTYPTGIYAIKENGNWYAFVTNANSSTLTRLFFGSSLLNVPTGQNLGNIGGKLNSCWDIQFLNYCGETIAFVINANTNFNDIIKLDFKNSVTNVPTAISYGNIGNLNFPHCISKLFRVNEDVYTFIPNVNNSTISRVRFTGCNNSNLPNSGLQNPPSISYNLPGTFNINLTVDDGLPTQASICKQVVVVSPAPSLPVQNLNFCENDQLEIDTHIESSTYLWNTGAATNSITVSTPGIYWVETSQFGCSKKDTFNIAFGKKPIINIGIDTSVCEGETLILSAQVDGNYTYSWIPSVSLSNPSALTTSASPLTTTKYILTAKDENCYATDSVLVVVKPIPVVQLGVDTSICSGSSITFNAGNPGAIYQWQNGDIDQTFTTNSSGEYRVTVTKDGCAASDNIHLALHPLPDFSVPADINVCKGNSIVLQTHAQNNYSYIWYPINGLSSSTSHSPSALINDNIVYYITATNGFSCQKTDSIRISSKAVPVVDLGSDTTICNGRTINLNAGNSGATYLWNTGSTLQSIPASANGVYSVTVSKEGCSTSDSITVSLKNLNSFNLIPKDANICSGNLITLAASGGTNYQWFTSSGSLNNNDSSIIVNPITNTQYSVRVEDSICNFSDTLYSAISLLPPPTINLSKSNDIDCNKPSTQLFASGGIAYKWSPNYNINDVNQQNPIVKPMQESWYKVMVTGANNCVAEDSIKVLVEFNGDGKFHIPNAFTPNGDGKNDCFGVKYFAQAENFELNIFNRWGECVFRTTNINDCWNGFYKGKLQNYGMYVYYIRFKGSCGETFKKGTLVLIK